MSVLPPRAPKRPPVTVKVAEHDGPPIDLEAWARRAAEIAMRVEGITPGVAPVPASQVGSGR